MGSSRTREAEARCFRSRASAIVVAARDRRRERVVGGAATTIRIGVMSDCKGAFGSFDAQDQAGVYAALSQYAGAKPKDPNDPRKGITGGSIAGHPIKIVAVGCGSDNADLAIKETRRIMEQNKADVMIGPLSGDESVAIAKYAKAHPTKTFVDGSAGAQDTTLKVRAPNFFRFNGDGAQWNAGLGDLAYNKLGWKTAAVIAGQLQLRLDVGRRLHRRVLRRRRQRHAAGVSRRSTRPTTRPTRSSSRPTSTARSSRSAARA